MKLLVGLGLFGLAAFLVMEFMVKAGPPAPPPKPPDSGHAETALPPDLHRNLAGAGDLVAPTMFREVLERYEGTARERTVRDLLAARSNEVLRGLTEQVERYLTAYRYRTAAELVEHYLAAWKGMPAAVRMQTLLDEVRAEQGEQVRSRQEEAEALLAAGRFDAAREALLPVLELEPDYQARLDEARETLKRRIRVAQYEATPPVPAAGERVPGRPEAARAVLAAPPPLPGFPHPDVKRLAEARELMAQARRLFAQRRFQPAAKALADVIGYYGDLAYVQRRQEAVGAMTALARHAAKGVAGLFRATKAEMHGRSVRLQYTFKNEDEFLDWEELPTIPHKDPGEFKPARDGVRGSGVMTYLHRGVFDNDVEIRCEVAPNKLKTHGLVFAQSELETRQLMWAVTNHWLVEGENYVLERPGHSILMFGKGVNNDVPVDSPETGFIFRGPTLTAPNPLPGEAFRISFSLHKDRMKGTITCREGKGSRAGSALGDDNRGIERVRPGLFVIQNTVVFRDIVIVGHLHPSFEKHRVAQLLDIASTLD